MIALLSAPSNLGLRPPVPGGVPGCAKAWMAEAARLLSEILVAGLSRLGEELS